MAIKRLISKGMEKGWLYYDTKNPSVIFDRRKRPIIITKRLKP